MKRHLLLQGLTLALSTAAAGCGSSEASSAGSVGATFAISQSSLPASASASAVDSSGSDTLTFGGRRIRRALIDSLIVIVTRVDVLPDSTIHRCHPPIGDSVSGFRPGEHGPGDGCGPIGPGGGPGGPGGPMGPRGEGDDDGPHDHPLRPDSLVPPDTGWGSAAPQWYSLDIVGRGHLNLLALPTDTTTGLTLASGTLPTGEYGAARLIVSSAKIYFDTTFTTSNGFTFQSGTAYDVTLPSRDSVMGIMTDAGFTLSTAGANVVLAFDPNTMLRGAKVTSDGKIVIQPVLHPCGRH
ncbi:MAG TPA: DUF4382 domain-containing protein [Gemmatimonadales bacterium]|jgi:hypothetical protein